MFVDHRFETLPPILTGIQIWKNLHLFLFVFSHSFSFSFVFGIVFSAGDSSRGLNTIASLYIFMKNIF